MICTVCGWIGIAKGLCRTHYMAAYRRKSPRRYSTRGDFQTNRAKPRLTHADRPGSVAGAKVVVSHDGGILDTATQLELREERNGKR